MQFSGQFVHCAKSFDGASIQDAHLVDEAATAETHGGVCRWLLRQRLETMSTTDIAKCSEQILKAKTIRNKAVEKLNIDQPPTSPWQDAIALDECTMLIDPNNSNTNKPDK